VIGGRGKMGRWTADFLASQGFAITIADPAGDVPGYDYVTEWHESKLDHDIIVVATPIRAANEVLGELAERPPGVIFDMARWDPLRAGLERARAAGTA
jgi:chorismate mutase/prephenate dehydrogenase